MTTKLQKSNYRYFSLLCLVAGLLCLWFAIPSQKSIATMESQKSVQLITKSIEDICIGERTLGTNPEGRSPGQEDDPILTSVKQCGYAFVLPHVENHTISFIRLLRPENWLESENVQIRRLTDNKILSDSELESWVTAKEYESDPQNYSLEIYLDLPEVGAVGWAMLVGIDDQVKIKEGEGNVVTGTFAHISDSVIDLQIEGQNKPIGCTANHPFWSVDRQEFVEAGQLREGERLQLFNGETKRVIQSLPRPGPEIVYNLEVFGEHVYQVTTDGVLVHNVCAGQHHLIPVALGSPIPYKHKILTFYSSNDHTTLQNALNAFLEKKTTKSIGGVDVNMFPRRGNSGAVVRANYTPQERYDYLYQFYQKFKGGSLLSNFEAEWAVIESLGGLR